MSEIYPNSPEPSEEIDIVDQLAKRLRHYDAEFGNLADFSELDDESMAKLLGYVSDLDADSLDLVEALDLVLDEDGGDGDQDGGFSFDREPRNPLPYSGVGSIALSEPTEDIQS